MMNFSFDAGILEKEIKEAAKALAKEKTDKVVNYAVNTYFDLPRQHGNFKGGEGYLFIKDIIDTQLLSESTKEKTTSLLLRRLEERIAEVVEKAVDNHLRKTAYTTVKEMAEKDPQALLQLLLNYEPGKEQS